MNFQSVKGMKDILPEEVMVWQVLEAKTRRFLEAYGFRELRTPALEATELFSRSIGEASDIVHKEMYTFEDRGGRSLTLRPEMTASVVRAALEHNLLQQSETLCLYYMGPMYRAERPQAGRKREFHQVGVEILNTSSSSDDAELIILIKKYLERIGLSRFILHLNNLGSQDDRAVYAKHLSEFFGSRTAQLCPDCQYRLSKNVLRIFDCKTKECQPLIAEAPVMKLSKKAEEEFERIQSSLREAKVSYQLETKLVRGLDYYTGCVFEVTAEGLGAQDALLAGGRYDSLIRALGGPEMGACGFALGVERLFTALEANGTSLAEEALRRTVYVAAVAGGETACMFYREIGCFLEASDRRAVFSFSGKNIGAHLGRASRMKVGYVLIVGDDEYGAGEVTVKNMSNGTQKRLKLQELPKAFEEI